ncbi:MAG TPA: PEGA domain-containing protein [Candidatus Acidoferrum sp.]|nr:PEGA domain-containing protein [Candidatus Acidoferrum sp.]
MLNRRNEALREGKLFQPMWLVPLMGALILFFSAAESFAGNEVMGEVRFEGVTKAERGSGVWIDGQYVGYLKELKGDKKVMLLPGGHEIIVRQAGLDDFVRKIVVEPGQKQTVRVAMQKSAGWVTPSAVSTLKLKVQPDRAAVFLDGRYIGHVGEFGGKFHSMVIASGTHRVKIELPGYRTFETEITLLAGQKSEVKTDLVKGSIEQNDAMMKQVAQRTASNPH